MEDWRRQMRGLLRGFDNRDWWPTTRRLWPPVNVSETEDAFRVECEVPGLKSGDVDISVAGDQLTIKGETKRPERAAEDAYHRRERRFGEFSRTVELPSPVNADKVTAELADGVLRIELEKAAEARPKRITVKGA
jgi:HSP20 family protein